MVREIKFEGNIILLAEPVSLPKRTFIGREEELTLCRIAWGINAEGTDFMDHDTPPLHFRL